MTPWLRSCQRVAALALLMLGAGGAMAQPCTRLPADRSVSDGHGGCLALVPIGPPRNPPQVLIVALHGDRGGELEARHLDGWSRAAAALAGEHRRVLLMIRPGYRSPAGHSSGWANPQDDDYTAANVARVAGALATLRQDLQPRHLVLIGHSGGAATAALVLGRHPGVVDAALLLGCPCDVPPWRTHRSAQRGQAYRPWSASLNPLAFAARLNATTPILAATGSRDDNTLPVFAHRWVQAAAAGGAHARFEEVEGHDHTDILRWAALPERVDALVAALPR